MACAMQKSAQFKRCQRIFGIWKYHFSSKASTSPAVSPAPLISYRTTADPNSFTTRNVGQWYTVPVAHLEKLLYKRSLPRHYVKQVDTLLECSFMVRRPLIDILACLRQMNPDSPVNRYVFFGAHGTGKTTSLWQTVQWAHANKWIVCFLSSARQWNGLRTELVPSTWRPNRFDLPLVAQDWLTQFKKTNETLLTEYKLTTNRDYTWTARETTSTGSPLMEIVDLGITRPKLASDCMGALLRELKIHAKEKRVKVMIAIGMANTFFVRTYYRRPDGIYMYPSEVSIMRHMTEFCSHDWNNGAVVLTVDHRVPGTHTRPPYLPYYLLGQEGFEALDPFVPIETTNYTDHEANNCLEYYIDKKWIQSQEAKTEDGRREIIYLSTKNPFLLERMIAPY